MIQFFFCELEFARVCIVGVVGGAESSAFTVFRCATDRGEFSGENENEAEHARAAAIAAFRVQYPGKGSSRL